MKNCGRRHLNDPTSEIVNERGLEGCRKYCILTGIYAMSQHLTGLTTQFILVACYIGRSGRMRKVVDE